MAHEKCSRSAIGPARLEDAATWGRENGERSVEENKSLPPTRAIATLQNAKIIKTDTSAHDPSIATRDVVTQGSVVPVAIHDR